MEWSVIRGSVSSRLKVRYSGESELPEGIDGLASVLECWGRLQHPYFKAQGDIAWWWGERPSVSLLTGAFCKSGGTAIEEYRDQKWKRGRRQYVGRGDLYATYEDSEYSLEAKYRVVNLRNRTDTTIEMVRAEMASAIDDQRRASQTGHWAGGVGFFPLVYRMGHGQAASARLDSWIDHPVDLSGLGASHWLRLDYTPEWVRAVEGAQEAEYWTMGATVLVGVSG